MSAVDQHVINELRVHFYTKDSKPRIKTTKESLKGRCHENNSEIFTEIRANQRGDEPSVRHPGSMRDW
jgi:hypothetical protein